MNDVGVAVHCVALNECQYDNGGCDQICTDTRESYVCSCQPGFQLQPNAHTCVPIGRSSAACLLVHKYRYINYRPNLNVKQSLSLSFHILSRTGTA